MNRERPGHWNKEDAMLPLWRKRTDQHGRVYKKSQLQAQLYVNRRQCALTEAVLNFWPSGGPRWDALAGAVAAEPITAVPRHIALA